MTLARYKLSDYIEIEEATDQPFFRFTQLHGYPDTSNWYLVSGPAYIEGATLVLDNDSPAGGTSRPEEDEVLEFVASLAELDAWDETAEWRWESVEEEED